MRAYFDDQIFGMQQRGGISRYFVELLRAFRADPGLGVDVTTPWLWTTNQHLLDVGLGRRLRLPLGSRRRVLGLVNRSRPRGRSDLVHHTYYDPAYLARSRAAGPRVVTVYDMIPELMPELFPQRNPHEAKREFVAAADLVLCISESTARDLEAVYGPVRAPVVVTPLGVDQRFRPDASRPASLPDRYLLFVGTRSTYKNDDLMLRAFAAADLSPDVELVLAGGGPVTAAEQARFDDLGIAARVLQLNPSDDELPGYYAHATGFVFPSRYEGFGLPALEAMAAGCPTVLADTSSLPEVGGAAALDTDPDDVAGLARLLERLVTDPDLRADLRSRGLDRVPSFTWAATARRTADAYRALVAGELPDAVA
jgi:glycosyltransferase involved in cell wall biosynthesis